MRNETRRKLDAETRREWWQLRWAAVAALIAGLVGAYVATPWSIDRRRDVEAVVTYATIKTDADTGSSYTTLDAKLDNGQLVRARGLPQMLPASGARVVLEERSRWFSVHEYVWTGRVKPPS